MNGQIREVAKKVATSNRLRKLVVVLLVIVLILGLAMPAIESTGSRSTIDTYYDGIYFAVTTVTGVGYGDLVPLTHAGRVIAMILQTLGVILFGTIAAYISIELFRYQEDYYVRRMMSRMDDLEIKIDELKKHLDYLVKK